ncbi:ABC transporter ATP-binding protein [Rugosimonospora africana]|uniref:Multidrug ABC transporter ATP-binding protein n=1 Tax=Rugosimonospora africana TaxID=556532 RepID=A0A8J3QZV4_9ACTN|nr:ABC transporter ATP-binding protein [Rugosimonospora africana]GIH19097.1 multidrug ABC transporter ATP-binding protein [Rugosimonospora africana]
MLGRGLRLLGRAIRDEPGMFLFGVLGSSLFAIMTVASAYVVGAVVGRVAVPAFSAHRVVAGSLALGAALIIAVSILKVIGVFGRRLGAGRMQFNLEARYRRQVTRRYLDLPIAWHQRHATGVLLSNANADIEAAWYPIAPFPFAVGAIVMLVAAVVSLLLVDWVLALVGIALFPLLFGVNVLYSRSVSGRVTRAQQLRAEVSAVAHESFDGALVVKAMGREESETRRFAERVDQLRDAMISVGRVRGLFDPVLNALPTLGTVAVLLVGALRLRSGAINIGDVVSVSFLFTVLGFPVQAIGYVLAELPRSVVGWERVQRVLTASGDMVYGAESRPAAGATALRFDRVDFAYSDGPPVLQDVSFEVPVGRTVALVGPTGSGKSTIASLAARLVDPDSGTVTLDGRPLPELSAAALAGSVALVPQVPFVFDDTVRGNVTLDRGDIDDAEVWQALRLAQADGFVAALPDSLNTAVGERGTSLSGGQRQRLTLARALAGRPGMLILDDATSAVDPRVESAILGALRTAEQASSVLVVAYRRATIALADEVIYLEQGRVIARGTHAELLDTVPGYAALVRAYEQVEA